MRSTTAAQASAGLLSCCRCMLWQQGTPAQSPLHVRLGRCEGLCRHAAVPATCAVAISWVLTNSFIVSKLPEASDARCILAWLIPIVLLDAVLWTTQLRQEHQDEAGHTDHRDGQHQAPALAAAVSGLDLYRSQRSAACAPQRALPAVQRNVLLLLQTCAQQLAIQGVLSTGGHLLLSVCDCVLSSRPTCMGHVHIHSRPWQRYSTYLLPRWMHL